jgi:hypothetical protein
MPWSSSASLFALPDAETLGAGHWRLFHRLAMVQLLEALLYRLSTRRPKTFGWANPAARTAVVVASGATTAQRRWKAWN